MDPREGGGEKRRVGEDGWWMEEGKVMVKEKWDKR